MAEKKTTAKKKDEPKMGDEPKGHIEGEFKEQPDNGTKADAPAQTALAVREASPQALSQWRPEFAKADVDRAVVQVQEKKRFFENVMREGSHYAIIPGQKPTPRIDQQTGQQAKDAQGNLLSDPPKPALLKPGAEMLLASMGLHPVLVHEQGFPVVEQRDGEWYIEFERVCRIYVQTGPHEEDRMLVAQASGSANTWEDKYRYRGVAGRACPNCGKTDTIRKGSAQYAPRTNGRTGDVLKGFEQGGFYCWKKMDGCGEIFPDNDERITSQSVEKKKNENPHDLKNTMLKMADKRALVAATLLATGCSDLFTQDIEDAITTPAPAAPKPTGASSGDNETAPPPSDAKGSSGSATSSEAKKPESPEDEALTNVRFGKLKVAWAETITGTASKDPKVAELANKRKDRFTAYMKEHGGSSWDQLRQAFNKPCHLHKEERVTYGDEACAVLGVLSFDPDAVPTGEAAKA